MPREPEIGEVEVSVVRVFCGPGGGGGNELGVVLDGSTVPPDHRQALAAHLGYAETVFVDSPATGTVKIFTPDLELPFAGHPVVGTAWLLAQAGHPADTLRTPAGEVGVRREDGMTWASARPEWCPPFELVRLESPEEVERADPGDAGWRYVWAFADEERGIVRARSFVPEAGVPEDEATGSAALRLCAELGRPLRVRQGRGSLIHALPLGDGLVEIGGTVTPA